MENKENKTEADIEWEQRTLCSDESCIGVIGPNGRCNECGLPYSTDPSEEHREFTAEEDFEEDDFEEDDFEEDDLEEETEDVAEDGAEVTQTDLEWEQRTLCIDESCIGVIGPDGRCKECGKPYDGGEEQTVDI